MTTKNNCNFKLSSGANKGFECAKSTTNPQINGKYYCGKISDPKSHYYKMLPSDEKQTIEPQKKQLKDMPNNKIISKIKNENCEKLKLKLLNDDIYYNEQFKFLYDKSKNLIIGKYSDDPNIKEKLNSEDVIIFESFNFTISPDAIYETDENLIEDDNITSETESEESEESENEEENEEETENENILI